MNEYEDFLAHYGVLGMKWGVRKQRPKSSGKSRKKSKTPSLPKKRKKKTSSKKSSSKKTSSVKRPNQMTDDELKSAISRMELEKKYSTLKNEHKTVGEKLIGEIAYSSAKNIGMQLVTYGLGSAVNKLAKKEIVNPKKGQRDKK